jgi:hypothetical protein
VTDELEVGQIRLYDGMSPGLAAGAWTVKVSHDVLDGATTVNPKPFTATQELIVTAPQFSIDPSAVVATFPPATSAGPYAEVLPHVVLAEPLLPWERPMRTAGAPWLALLVLTDDELIGGASSPTRAQVGTVAGFLAADPAVRKPAVTVGHGVAGTDPCTYIQLPVEVLTAVVPRPVELRYLAHCRQVDTGDKAMAGLDEDGLFAVVVANRFPATVRRGQAKNIVHLVSLEGLDDVLGDKPDWGGYRSVVMVSLASWTFSAAPDQTADFRGLAAGLVRGGNPPGDLLLRLSPPAGTSPAQAEVRARLSAGYVPVTYHTRSGETTFAWNRGPLTPVLPAPVPKSGPWRTADAALAYDRTHGVFDVSLAAAFSLGRKLAVADRSFAQDLLELRQRLHAVTDALLYRLTSDLFSQTQIDQIGADTTIQAELAKLLDAQLLADIGAGAAPVAPPVPVAPSVPVPDPDPQTALRGFLADPRTRAAIVEAVQADLDPVAQWLATLLLLVPVPFTALVPDDALLPAESLRVFYLDGNWLNAAVDGALSIALESSLHTFYDTVVGDTIRVAAADAARIRRDVARGADPAHPGPTGSAFTCGFLLRSAMVSGWPNLGVRAFDAANAPVALLRLDRLSSSVMFGLFAGVPAVIELAEPQEGFAFGAEGGKVNLRNLLPPANPGDRKIGESLPGEAVQVFDPAGQHMLCLRSIGSRVLVFDPAVATGVVATIGKALDAASRQKVSPLGPADVAIQLVRPPEAVQFRAPSAAGAAAGGS